MDAELAKELREATDQLLDLGPLKPSAFPSSPHLQQRRQATPTRPIVPSPSALPAFSANSKLELIHSPTDVRPFQWPTPPTSAQSSHVPNSPSIPAAGGSNEPIKIVLGDSILDDADDNLPARGLSSWMESVKAATAQSTTDSVGSPLLDDINGQDRAATPSKLRVRTPINDIYINQYGERVVNGKVVGRMLGGRPRPAPRNEDASEPSGSTSIDRTSSPSLARSSSPLQPPSDNAHASTSHAKTSATSPPAFFLESFPDAFSPAPTPTLPTLSSSSPGKKKDRRPSAGHRPPSILKAPRAVSGALILSHDDDFNESVMVRDTSFHTASDFGSSSSSPSKQLSPRPRKATLSSTSSRADADAEVATVLKGLQLHGVGGLEEGEGKGLLSPNEGRSTVDSARSKIELPSLRRPTPTIELSQAKVETVVLHGNRRQARASGAVVAMGNTDANVGSWDGLPAVSPPTGTLALPSLQPRTFSTEDFNELTRETRSSYSEQQDDPWNTYDTVSHQRHGSASEPSSPLMSPRRPAEMAEQDGHTSDDDKASLESAPSSLVSLPVSALTSSSRSPSHASLERRSLPSRRRSSSHRRPSSPTEVFAREVRIRGWSEVGSQARGWVVFELRILTKQGTPIITHKRFSSFVKLRRTLLEECKDQAKWLPQLPTRRTGLLSKYDAKYLEKRRRALQRWLETVALDRVWGGSEGLREWVLDVDHRYLSMNTFGSQNPRT